MGYLSLAQQAILGLSVVSMALLFWKGRRPERIAGLCLLGLMIGSGLVDYDGAWKVAALSVTAAVVLAWLSLAYDRWWLIFALGLQLLAVATHLIPLVDPDYRLWAAVTLRLAIWTGLMLLALFGVLECRLTLYARVR